MWQNLTTFNIPAGNLIIRGIVVYLSVILLLRIGGKKQIGQLGATEFVAVLLISNAVQNAMNGGDNSLVGGLILAAVLVGLSWVVSYLTYRSKFLRVLFEGTPRLLVHKGKPIEKNLIKERITHGEFQTMLRKQ